MIVVRLRSCGFESLLDLMISEGLVLKCFGGGRVVEVPNEIRNFMKNSI